MAWNGSGTFSKIYTWDQDRLNDIPINSQRHDTQDDTFVSGINNCITKDGQNAATGNLPMGGNRHTNVGNATARNEYATLGQLQDRAGSYVVTTGSSNAYIAALSPAITAYTTGLEVSINANFTNTGAATININSLGTKNIFYNGAALDGNELTNGRVYELTYDGTQFNITSPVSAEYTQGQSILLNQVFS